MRILHRYKKNPCNVQYSIDGGGIEYGLLYNWYAATDTRNIAANGWYIPSKAEMDGLVTHLGGASVAGGKLKEIGTDYWLSPNVGATNEIGFNGRGGGKRGISVSFTSLNIEIFIMSSTTGGYNYHYLYLTSNSSQATTSNIFTFKGGSSIRLVSDATGVADGTTTVYIGNDGKTYSAIAINGLYWTQYNLAETQYRNGDTIPEVTDNSAWAALTTGALCAYNNDWNYVETTSDPNAINYALISGELPITVELIGNTTHTNNHIILESGSFTDIPGGTYTFKVTDALGCEESEIIEIPYSEPIALNSSYDIDRKTLETCTVFKGFDYTVFGFTGETMFDRVKITSVPTNGTLSRGLLDTILVNDELIYPSDFNNGLYYRTSSIEKVDYSDTIGFQVRVNGLWSNTATITINVNSCIFADDCIEYGYLYNWYAATDVRGITSEGGFLVSSKADWETLLNYIDVYEGVYPLAGSKLKETGVIYWNAPNSSATNEYNFNARGSGARDPEIISGTFDGMGEAFQVYTSDDLPFRVLFPPTEEFVLLQSYPVKVAGASIRLVRSAIGSELGQEDGTACAPYIGNNGISYKTVKIGTQVWLAENLAETQYSNGDLIPTVEDNLTWTHLTTGAKCAYDNNYEYVGCDETGPVPVVTTNAATNIGDTFATLNGEISGDATVTENGFCWGENAFPTKEDSVVVSGSGTGSISDIIESLECPTTYHFRAYAEYSGGIVYGENQQFTITTTTLPLFYSWDKYDFQDGNGRVDITGSYQECADAVAHSKISGMGGWNGTLHRCLGAVVGNQMYNYNGNCVKSLSQDGWRVTGLSPASLKIINVLDGLIIEVYDE